MAPTEPRHRYGIGEWYGHTLPALSATERRQLAQGALNRNERQPPCPFQPEHPPCAKAGGVCSLQRYREGPGARLGTPIEQPVIVCPRRFEQDHLLVRWLSEIVDFTPGEARLAREVPFMRSASTGRPAGMIDLVVARTTAGNLTWYGLEIQAVYFSGRGMRSEFEALLAQPETPLFPNAIRRPDWRSSSAKRLMPQLQIKVPTLRRWGSKLAVAVDRSFFDAIGGPSAAPSHDLDDGDIIWLVPELAPKPEGGYQLTRGHWEVLTLEASSNKLLAAETVQRRTFEQVLRGKLQLLE